MDITSSRAFILEAPSSFFLLSLQQQLIKHGAFINLLKICIRVPCWTSESLNTVVILSPTKKVVNIIRKVNNQKTNQKIVTGKFIWIANTETI